MKNKKWFIILGIVALLAIVAIGIYKNQSKATDDNVVRIGAILPLTGEASYLGLEIQKGMECQRRIFETHGVKVEITYQDSMYSAKGGVSAYQAMQARHHLPVVIVAGSTVANAVSEYVQGGKNDETALVGILVSSERSSEKNKRFFRCWPSGNDEAKIMAKYLRNYGEVGKVGVLYQNDELGLDGKDAFVKSSKALGIEVAFEEAVPKGLSDAEPIVGKLMSYPVKKVYCVGSTPGIGLVVKSLKSHGYSGGFLFTSTLDVANLRKIIGDGAISGILYTSMFIPAQQENSINNAKNQKLLNGDYRLFTQGLREINSRPNMLNVYGAVSVSFAEAISKNHFDSSSQFFQTILGELKLNERNGIDFPMYIKKANVVQLGNDDICETILPYKD